MERSRTKVSSKALSVGNSKSDRCTFQSLVKRILPMLAYLAFYMAVFVVIENRQQISYYEMYIWIDDVIPFCEVFVIPYILWFIYIPAAVLYLAVKDGCEYHKLCLSLAIGMSVFLVVSIIFPTVQNLRLDAMPRDNVFTRIISYIWLTDTPTNVFPSVHVSNSLTAFLALNRCEQIRKRPWLWAALLILTVSIIMATMFIKQHSCLDVISGIMLSTAIYCMVYKPAYGQSHKAKLTEFI